MLLIFSITEFLFLIVYCLLINPFVPCFPVDHQRREVNRLQLLLLCFNKTKKASSVKTHLHQGKGLSYPHTLILWYYFEASSRSV